MAGSSHCPVMGGLKIGEVALALGIPPSAIRFYESQGIVRPQRSSGGTRTYTQEDVERLRAVLNLAEAGTPLRVIQQLAMVRRRHATGDDASREVSGVIRQLAQEIGRKRSRLSLLEEDLARALSHAQACYGCLRPPSAEGCRGCDIALTLTGAEGTELFRIVWDQGG